MRIYNRQNNNGFTIIEAMVAIFILTVSVSSMLGITASSAVSARYSNNELTANYLVQEAVDSIRNSRDTIVFQQKQPWSTFLTKYNICFFSSGCILKIEDFDPTDITGKDVDRCNEEGGVCPNLKYDSEAETRGNLFYNYTSGDSSEFKRTVNMVADTTNADQLNVTVKVDWFNGESTNKRSQSLTFYLLNWQKN